MKNFISISFCIFLLATTSVAQNTNIIDLFRSDFRQAEIYFKDLAYRNAIELYERELERNPKNQTAKIKIAECHRLLKDAQNAEYWYEKASEDGPLPAINNYHYGQVLSSNQKYRQARALYNEQQRQNPLDSRSQLKIDFIDNMDFYLRDSALYEVSITNINSKATDFGPAYYKDGIVFLSSRDQDLFVKHQSSPSSANESLFDLYYAPDHNNGFYGSAVKFQQQINSKFHEGPLSFGSGGSLVFTRNNYFKGRTGRSSDGRMKLKLYFAELDEEQNLTNLEPYVHNSDEYSTAHPYWSEDGNTLYFSSDMPGGLGGADLYISKLVDGAWSTPVNLGKPINTEGDEMFPFMTDNHLYFSSDGHGGFGGLDIYFSVIDGEGFKEVINLGYPANSSHDDFSFIMHPNLRQGLFASNRNDVRNDDIFNYAIKHSVVAGYVIEEEENYVIADATITLKDTEDKILKSVKSDQNGSYHLDLPLDTDYKIEVTKDGFTQSATDHHFSQSNSFEIDSAVLFMWAHDLFAEGIIYGNETQEKLKDVEVVLTNTNTNESQSIVTDSSGGYKFLLQTGNEYLITLKKELFVTMSQEINTLNIKKGTIRNDFVIEEQFLNKGLVLFGYNEDNFSSEFINETQTILNILKKNPSTFLIISAHADSRGSAEYNLKLSETRAQNVEAFFLQNGISSDRIISRGFGESLIINRCTDGIHCIEEDHSKNRRAELKIEKELPEGELIDLK